MKLNKLETAQCLVLGFLMFAGGLFSQPATAQTYTVLYTFTGMPDGNRPLSGLLRVGPTPFSDLTYGTTYQGGTNNSGSIFKLSAPGQEAVLYSFTGGADGGFPQFNGVLVRDSEGNLYGTTNQGGTSKCGVVFKLAPDHSETVLHTFTGMMLDGCAPQTGLIRDAAGNFYGTTRTGGSSGEGVVFTITAGVFNTLYSFTGGADGGQPYGDLVFDPTGNLYGTTTLGGTSNRGVIFKLTPSGQESVLYSFTGGADGRTPVGLVRDASGNLYGMAQGGGSQGDGVVFQLSSSDVYTVLHSFTGADGQFPSASPTRDPAGNLYGTTIVGGANSLGVVFKLRPDGTYTVLHNFTGGADGAAPFGGDLIWAPSASLGGTLYGSASGHGSASVDGRPGSGVLFSLTTQ
jgi:uncharacterized repeat protein (TIGR03803 family)